MKKIRLFLLLFVLLMISLWGCRGALSDGSPADKADKGETTEALAGTGEMIDETTAPQLDKVKMICELATLECRYHNVAKSVKEAGTGLSHIGEKERIFWIEYTGIAEISFRIEELKMEQDGTNITITLPEPQVTCRVDSDSWTPDSYVISDDQWIQKNPITADDQTRAVNEAQTAMEENIRNNSSLLNTAKLQARELIENYITQVGEAAGVTYTVNWEEAETQYHLQDIG